MNNSTHSINVSNFDGEEVDAGEYYWPSLDARIFVTVIFGLVLLVGIVGNILVLSLILLDKTMHTTVNRCLFSLAVADLIILVLLPVLPLSYEFLDDDSHLGKNMCYFLVYYDRGAVACSALIFIFVSVDRYIAVCHPLTIRHFWSGRRTYIALVLIWGVAIATSAPYAYMMNYARWEESNVTYYFCVLEIRQPWQVQYDTAFIILLSFVPIPFLGVLYGRMIYKLRQNVPGETQQDTKSGRQGRSQVVVMLLTVVILFVACQVPFSLIRLFDHHSPHVFSFRHYDDGVFALIWSARILIYINSAANPVVYFAVSSNFRHSFVRVFCCCRSKLSDQRSVSGPATELSTLS